MLDTIGAEGVNTYIHHSDRTTLQRCLYILDRFLYDIEIKTREQSRNIKLTEIERFCAWLLVRCLTTF